VLFDGTEPGLTRLRGGHGVAGGWNREAEAYVAPCGGGQVCAGVRHRVRIVYDTQCGGLHDMRYAAACAVWMVSACVLPGVTEDAATGGKTDSGLAQDNICRSAQRLPLPRRKRKLGCLTRARGICL